MCTSIGLRTLLIIAFQSSILSIHSSWLKSVNKKNVCYFFTDYNVIWPKTWNEVTQPDMNGLTRRTKRYWNWKCREILVTFCLKEIVLDPCWQPLPPEWFMICAALWLRSIFENISWNNKQYRCVRNLQVPPIYH